MAAEDYFDLANPPDDDGPEIQNEEERWEDAHRNEDMSCNGHPVMRTNRGTGEQFFGCSNWPQCRATMSVRH